MFLGQVLAMAARAMQNPRRARGATRVLCCFTWRPRSSANLLGSSLVVRVVRAEVEEPPAVIPFERHFPPCQRNLWIGIERADVWPRCWRILLRIAQGSVVRVASVARPSVAWHLRIVVSWSATG